MNALIIDPIDIKKGAQYRLVTNGGYFDHVMRVKSIYNGFFMLESDAIGRQCIGWQSMQNGDVKVYGLDSKKVEAPSILLNAQ